MTRSEMWRVAMNRRLLYLNHAVVLKDEWSRSAAQARAQYEMAVAQESDWKSRIIRHEDYKGTAPCPGM